MRLENVIALTRGNLINSPFVNQFSNIVYDAKAVKRGDLFIAFDEKSIEEAIINGAYGVLFDKPTQISDSEIAWIKVNNLDNALLRLLRFLLISKKLRVYACDGIILSFASQLVTQNNFKVVSGSIQTIFKLLTRCEEGDVVLFSDEFTQSDIFTSTQPLPQTQHNTIKIVEKTLFETSFIYDGVYYERQQITPLFIPYLEQLFSFLKSLAINFRIKKFLPINYFEPLFINKNFEIKEFGTTDRVVIFEKNKMLLSQEVEFLQQEASWAQILFLLPQEKQIVTMFQNRDLKNFYFYIDEEEVKSILKKNYFHFAYIFGQEKHLLRTPLIYHTQPSLFDF